MDLIFLTGSKTVDADSDDEADDIIDEEWDNTLESDWVDMPDRSWDKSVIDICLDWDIIEIK